MANCNGHSDMVSVTSMRNLPSTLWYRPHSSTFRYICPNVNVTSVVKAIFHVVKSSPNVNVTSVVKATQPSYLCAQNRFMGAIRSLSSSGWSAAFAVALRCVRDKACFFWWPFSETGLELACKSCKHRSSTSVQLESGLQVLVGIGPG